MPFPENELNTGNARVAPHCCDCARRENETWERVKMLEVANDLSTWKTDNEKDHVELRNSAISFLKRALDKHLLPPEILKITGMRVSARDPEC